MSVNIGSGAINAWPTLMLSRRARARANPVEPVDRRPLYVRMREMHDSGKSWDRVADEFGYPTANGAREAVLAGEKKHEA